jgi:hypothetical protein
MRVNAVPGLRQGFPGLGSKHGTIIDFQTMIDGIGRGDACLIL